MSPAAKLPTLRACSVIASAVGVRALCPDGAPHVRLVPCSCRAAVSCRAPVFCTRAVFAPAFASSFVKPLPAEGSKPLLLGVGVDVRPDDECHNVEEWDPSFLRKELLCKGECDRRRDPAHLHDRHEAGSNRGPDLVESSRSSDYGHRHQIDAVLDRRNLCSEKSTSVHPATEPASE